ncbi:hypothetical protein CesoFtcFv8_007251 [Champsocephalus esox]|uniref:Uncharacterized protein n=1 Tax=Champsocephalus esox TaxID=159716 RepID=A0AAN8H4P1_9TELE|nr:hypothetical protein CesoFtcFv8_007251 [Champsocephalus esox]
MAMCSSLHPANLICQPLVNQGWSHRAESWHRSWDQRTASPLRARRGQGLGDLCLTEVQLGCFTQQQPLRTGRRQPQDDPAHCITGNREVSKTEVKTTHVNMGTAGESGFMGQRNVKSYRYFIHQDKIARLV